MSLGHCPAGTRMRGLLAAAVILGVAAVTPAAAQSAREHPTPDGLTPHINAVLYHPEVVKRIAAWGLTPADVQYDVDALSAKDRARLAYVLTRHWRTNETHSQADLQAQFLVTLSLLRESTLFASVISSGASRLR